MTETQDPDGEMSEELSPTSSKKREIFLLEDVTNACIRPISPFYFFL